MQNRTYYSFNVISFALFSFVIAQWVRPTLSSQYIWEEALCILLYEISIASVTVNVTLRPAKIFFQ